MYVAPSFCRRSIRAAELLKKPLDESRAQDEFPEKY